MKHSRRAIIEMILFAMLAALALAASSCINHRDQVRLDVLKASAVAANARIVSKQCQNHGQVAYSFFAGGREYRRLAGCELDCSAARIGDVIGISYAKDDPNNSTCIPVSEVQCSIDGASDFGWLLALVIVTFGVGRAVLADEARQARAAGNAPYGSDVRSRPRVRSL